MSKKVTALTKAVNVEGNMLVAATDGTIRSVNSDVVKGTDVEEYEVAITKQGVAAIKKAAPLLIELDKIKSKIEQLGGDQSDLGQLEFEDEDGVPSVRVGCTAVYPNQLAGYMKSLGI